MNRIRLIILFVFIYLTIPPMTCLFAQPAKTSSGETKFRAHYAGRVEAAQQADHLAPFAGRAVKILASPGTLVREGQAVLLIAQRTQGENFADYTAKANISGVVDEIAVNPGSEFANGALLFSIINSSERSIKLAVSDRDHPEIKIGDKVTIQSEAQTVVGRVYQKSMTAIRGTGLFAVEVRLSDGLPIGAFAKVSFGTEAESLQNKKSGSGTQGIK